MVAKALLFAGATALAAKLDQNRARSGAPKMAAQGELLRVASLEADAVLAALGSSREGLLDRDALERLQQHGPNLVVQETRRGFALELFDRVRTPLNLLLLVLAGVSYYLDDLKSAVVISLMVVVAALLSAIQESRSTAAAEKLRAMVKTTATVLRQDKRKGVPEEITRFFHIHLHARGPERREIPLEQLAPGDVVHLSAGDMVPADVRVVSAKDLFINQASLTGESLPVEKFVQAEQGANALELRNVCFMGSNVVSGSATAVVVQTGRSTYFGALAANLAGRRVETSFDRGINRFTWMMIRFMLVMVPLVFLVNGFTKGDWLQALLFGVAVAVGLTPEMLPMIVTINLAKGALAMSHKKVIVKRLNAIQNFGAMDVLCTDKTGTLTQDKIILERHVDIGGEENEKVMEYAYLNSFYQSGLKNLLDVAVLEHMEVHDHLRPESAYRKVDEVPFDFSRRRMSVVVEQQGNGQILICKGAVEEIFSVCSHCEIGHKTERLDATDLDALKRVTRELNEDGFRVIAIAYRNVAEPKLSYGVADERDMTLVGYIAFLDPPKESSAEAIATLRNHGVAVKILTGDNEVVTAKVCREVDLPVDRIVLGAEVEAMSEQQLAEVAESVTVFAKLSPMQKQRVVKALHLKGHVVGFMGDGINDGPALKAADVGISVDSAVDIAKESADIILLEKSLMVLEEGVVEGRKVFGNITKYIKMGASSNFGNMFSVLGASAFLPFLPMAPIQVLLNNLLYDLSQTTIATDEVDDEYVRQPRKWEIGNIARFMLFVGPISSIFDYATFFTMLYLFGAWANETFFHTGWFVESLLSQTLIVHVIRTAKIPFLQSRASVPLLLTTVMFCSIGIFLPYTHFAPTLGFTHLPVGYWGALALILAGYLGLTQLVKTWVIRRFGLS
jgi:Mg2+-importing ATPase